MGTLYDTCEFILWGAGALGFLLGICATLMFALIYSTLNSPKGV